MSGRCSSSNAKKNVIIFRRQFDKNKHCRVVIVSVPCASLFDTDQNKSLPIFKQMLPRPEGEGKMDGMSCICVGAESGVGPAMYSFGGISRPCYTSVEQDNEHFLPKAYRYDLHELPLEVRNISECHDMKAKMFQPLLVQGSEDCVYCITYGKIGDNFRKPIFQMYSCKENKWTLFESDEIVDIIERCDPKKNVCYNIQRLAHVVIGRKLHLSLGHSSYTFDTVNHTWKTCKLFKTFWSDQEKKESGLSPSDFYGKNVFFVALDQATKKRKRTKLGGGPPFGFYGRGVVWDNNILLGVHYAQHCPLVAFLLDRKGRVVRSQRLTLNNLDLDYGALKDWARLVDLGRDGCFCLVHTRIYYDDDGERKMKMELVTFRVWKVALGDDDDEDFLECEVLRKDVVEKGLSADERHYDAFCV